MRPDETPDEDKPMQLDFDGNAHPIPEPEPRFDRPTGDDQILPDTVPMFVTPERGPTTIEEAFDRFHQANAWVYPTLVALARDLVASGRKRIGIKMLFEVLRWHYYRSTTDEASDFKINNNYAPYYARLIMENEPDLAGVFSIRKLTSA